MPIVSQGASEHYLEPAYYDRCYRDRSDDIRYYLGFAAGWPSARILEYGCGNGRISLELASAGHGVTGIDSSKPMLDSFRTKLASCQVDVAERVRLVHGDMREVLLPDKFSLVFSTFNTILHLYSMEDVRAFFGCVKEHLATDGRLVFDASVPIPAELARGYDRPYRVPRLKHPPSGKVVRYAERFDYDPISQVLRIEMEFTPLDGSPSWTTVLSHRQFYPQEIRAILDYEGFDVLGCHADFGTSKLGPDADSLVWVARRR